MNNLEKVIVEQSLKINELNDKINVLENLIKEYRIVLSKHESPGLLMDAVGRKILFDLALTESALNERGL